MILEILLIGPVSLEIIGIVRSVFSDSFFLWFWESGGRECVGLV